MRYVILASLLLFSPVSHSSEWDAVLHPVDLKDLTVEEAVALAVSNSVDLKKTTLRIKESETKLSEETAWNWLRPNLSLRGGVDIETGEPNFSLGVGVDLKDVMGAGKKRIKAFKFSVNEEKKNLDAIRASIGVRVTGAYREYKMSLEKLKVLEETLLNDEILLKKIEGSSSEVERLLIRSMVNQDRLALMSARQEVDRAETNLRELLGLDSYKDSIETP